MKSGVVGVLSFYPKLPVDTSMSSLDLFVTTLKHRSETVEDRLKWTGSETQESPFYVQYLFFNQSKIRFTFHWSK